MDHFVAQIIAPDRALDYDNLIYACLRCNSTKRAEETVLNPCQEAMSQHLRVGEDGTIEALTRKGRAHIKQLQLNHPRLTQYRARLVRVFKRLQALSQAEAEHRAELQEWFGFPDDLPNLAALRPPKGNTRPDGIADSFHERRRAGTLPETY